MLNVISSLFEPETVITLLISLAAFATVLSVGAPMFQSDPLKKRMSIVSDERARLRAELKGKNAGEPRLRDQSKVGVARQLVDVLNLRKVFEAEASRELLRQAGLRSERHLILYLSCRVGAPLGLGFLAFAYASVLFGDTLTPEVLIACAAVGAVLGNYLPYVMLRNMIARRQASIRRAWPDSLDLMLICVESGMAIEPALQRVAREIGTMSVPLAEELALTVAELSFLQDRRKAFENLAKRTGLPQVRSVVTSLIQAERYGTPLGTALRVLAQENRDLRMAEAERKAAALPPRLTVPMMLFFMPVIFVVIMGPIVITVSKIMQ